MRARLAWLSAAFLAASVAVYLNPAADRARAQEFGEEPVTVERVELVPATVVPGQTAVLRVTLGVAPDWHVYGIEKQENAIPIGLTVPDAQVMHHLPRPRGAGGVVSA